MVEVGDGARQKRSASAEEAEKLFADAHMVEFGFSLHLGGGEDAGR